MKSLTTLIAFCLAIVLQSAFAGAQATNASGHCTGMTVTDYVSSDFNNSTSSNNWVDITDGRLNFTTSATGCVMIMFSAVANVIPSSGYTSLHVRTLLDGNGLCLPALADDTFEDANNRAPTGAREFTRVCKNVPAGVHSVRVQFSCYGGTCQTTEHVLTLTHN